MATRTLSELSALYTSPDPRIEAALLGTETPDTFAKRGANIDSLRVLRDVRKLFPTAIDVWEQADAAQRRLLAGVGRGVLTVCVAQWARLESMWATQEGKVTADRGVRETGAVTLVDAHRNAILLRGRAVAALDAVAGVDPKRKLEVDTATGRADTDENLAQGLEALAALGRSWSIDPMLAAICTDGGIDAAWADDLTATAATLRAAVEADTRRMTIQVTQAQLDHQDGVVLHLLQTLMRIFDGANEVDRRIPRLFPASTYAVFGMRRPTDRNAKTSDESSGAAPDPAPAASEPEDGSEASPV